MEKQALCFVNNDEFEKFISNDFETVATTFVPRRVCEVVENGKMQLIPYTVFYHVDFAQGKINFFAYTRAQDITEERLKGKLSVGIGGHIDQVSDIVCDDVVSPKDDTYVNAADTYNMSASNFKDTIIQAAKREAREELGNISVIEKLQDSRDVIAIFVSTKNEVDKVHVCCLIPVQLTEEEMHTMLNNKEFNTEELASTAILPVNFKYLLEDFNFSKALELMSEEIGQKYDIESWGEYAIYHIAKMVGSVFSNNIKFEDMLDIMLKKIEIAKLANAANAAEANSETETSEETAA